MIKRGKSKNVHFSMGMITSKVSDKTAKPTIDDLFLLFFQNNAEVIGRTPSGFGRSLRDESKLDELFTKTIDLNISVDELKSAYFNNNYSKELKEVISILIDYLYYITQNKSTETKNIHSNYSGFSGLRRFYKQNNNDVADYHNGYLEQGTTTIKQHFINLRISENKYLCIDFIAGTYKIKCSKPGATNPVNTISHSELVQYLKLFKKKRFYNNQKFEIVDHRYVPNY